MPETTLEVPLEDTPEGCLWLAVEQTIKGLNLSGVSVIERRTQFWDDTLPTPCIVVCPAQETLDVNAGTNESDDVSYGFMVSVVKSNNRDTSGATAGWLLFCTRTIRRAFLNRSSLVGPELPTGSCLLRVTTEPGAKFIDAALRKNYDAGYVLVRCLVREQRP